MNVVKTLKCRDRMSVLDKNLKIISYYIHDIYKYRKNEL